MRDQSCFFDPTSAYARQRVGIQRDSHVELQRSKCSTSHRILDNALPTRECYIGQPKEIALHGFARAVVF
ncbi:hypothetical protein RSP822_17130 [Ralstonia solanacearum]|nr:hypothetical protein RSP822_17130 [Ralstonia solanacearum]